ncbi:MAG TPA: glycerate kinase [Mycobacteriales bacterium]|nr:glycerate kinase [Mycobacteriales bacterium]
MRVVVAPDGFGGTLSAVEAAEAIRAGWEQVAPGDELVLLPLSDGGPGFVDVLSTELDGQTVPVPTTDALGRPVVGAILVAGGTAYVESAQANGLHLLTAAERDPRTTSTYGLGSLLAAAVECGAGTIVVGLGGSATNDAGMGMLAALGVTPLDAGGSVLPYGGLALAGLDRLEGVAQLRGATLVAATDVDNPLCGPQGATAVFGPQKGLRPEDLERLDAALARWAEVAARDLPGAPADLADLPGAGAAGGLGAAFLALGGSRRSGLELVADAVDLDGTLAAADLVLTGEGSFDFQSLRGKVPGSVAAVAAAHGVPCLVLAGQVSLGRQEAAAAGVEKAYSVAEQAGSVEAALERPAARLSELAAAVAREWSRPGRP